MMAKATRKRVLSLLMTLVLAFSLLPVNALADSQAVTQANMQIGAAGGANYYHANGTPGTSGDYDVMVAKTVSATGTENLFNVNVQVQYKDSTTTTINSDAAVVLVLDTSYSMGNNYDTGVYGQTRLDAAKIAAKNFLDAYATVTNASAKRYVSIVTFNSNASARQITGSNYWVNVARVSEATDTDLTNAKNIITGLSTDRNAAYTNTEGGIQLARNLLGRSELTNLSISSKFAVLLTDGEPTYHLDGTNSTTTMSFTGVQGDTIPYNETRAYPDDYQDLKSIADSITSTSGGDAAMYSVLYGPAPETKLYIDNSQYNPKHPNWYPKYKEGSQTVQGLFDTFNKRPATGNILTAKDASTLGAVLGNILNQQQQSGSDLSSVTDAMVAANASTEDQVVDFISFINRNGATQSNGAISWNFALAQEDTDGIPAGFNSYSMSYRVKLNNTVGTFMEGHYYSLAPATLTYTQLGGGAHSVSSQIPTIQGYLGSLTLYKFAYQDSNLKLSNAPFALKNQVNTQLGVAAEAISRATVSGSGEENGPALGQVLFDNNIPSGFAYTLSETGSFTDLETNKAYDPTSATWTVTVAYGELTILDQDGNPVSNGFTVDDSLQQTYKDITITKTWHKPAQMGTAEITVYLWQDNTQGTPAGDSFAELTLNGSEANVTCDDLNVTVAYVPGSSGENTWTYTVHVPDNIPATGSEHQYKVTEAGVDGFDAAYGASGLTITNTATGTRSIYVAKHWVVPADSYKVPVTVELLREGKSFTTSGGAGDKTTLMLNQDNGWCGQWDDLPTFNPEDGQYYNYTVQEDVPDGYHLNGVPTGDGSNASPYVLTNTVNEQTTEKAVTKTWNDDNLSNGHRPDVTVNLYRADSVYATATISNTGAVTDVSGSVSNNDISVTESGNTWTITFTNLPRFEFTYDGSTVTAVSEYAYSAQEASTPVGYASSHSGLSIINTRAGTVDLTVYKSWADDFDSHPAVEITLNQNGSPFNQAGWTNPVNIDTDSTNSHTWSNLPKYDGDGREYHYTVAETGVPEGYSVSYAPANQGFDANGQATVTNTLNTDDTTTAVTVNKTWQQPAGTTHPDAVFTLSLLDDGGSVLEDGYDSWTMPTGTDLTGSHSFIVPKFYYTQDESGNAVENTYTYSVEESSLSDYNSSDPNVSEDGLTYSFTNTITGSVDVAVTKEWKDLLNDHSTSGAGAIITLYRYTDNIADKAIVDTWTVASGTSHTWDDQAQYDSTGHLYTYTVDETAVPSGYAAAVTGGKINDDFAFTVTNTIQQSYTNFTVSKDWVDGGLPNSERPAITLTLIQNGSTYGSATISGAGTVSGLSDSLTESDVSATLGADDTWTVNFNNLPVYNDDRTVQYEYSVSEAAIDTYDQLVNNAVGNAIITNTLKQGNPISVQVHKIWVDPADMEHTGDVAFTLRATAGSDQHLVSSVNGSQLPSGVTLGFGPRATAAPTDGSGNSLTDRTVDDWYYTFANLPKYDDNRNTITYAVDEGICTGYTSESVAGQPYTFRNTIEQDDVTLTGNKSWDTTTTGYLIDSEKPQAVDSIYVQLYRDSQPAVIDGVPNPVQVTAGNNDWAFSFPNLPKYDLTDGHAYQYEVYEVEATTTGSETSYARVANTGHIHYGTNSYTVSYNVNAVNHDTHITNTFDMPQNYYYQIIRNYTTTLSGATIYSAQEISVETATQAGLVSVTPGDYTRYNNVDFGYDPTGSVESAMLDTMHYLNTTIVLNYTRTLYTLQANYVFSDGSSHDGFDAYTSPALGTQDDNGNYDDPGMYTNGAGYSGIYKAAPAGYSISGVTVKDSEDAARTVDNDYSGGTFGAHDVLVTYTYAKSTATQTEPASFTIVKTDGTDPITSGSAVFTLYSDLACEHATDKTFTTSTVDGTRLVTAPSDMGVGTYYLKETSSPTGYEKSDTVWQIQVTSTGSETLVGNTYVTTTTYGIAVNALDSHGTVSAVSALDNNNRLLVVNAPQGTLQITKIVEGLTGTAAGTDHTYTFTVYNDSVSNTYTVTLNGNGTAATAGNSTNATISLPAGTYYVAEANAAIDEHNGPSTTYSSQAVIDNQTVGTVNVTSGTQSTITVTNAYSYDPQSHQVSYSVQKIWDDDSNHDGLRPSSVTVELLDRAQRVIDTKTIETPASGNTASTTFTFDSYASNYTAPYSALEVGYTDASGIYHAFDSQVTAVPGYDSPAYSPDNTGELDGTSILKITNTHTSDTVTVGAEKIWSSGKEQAVTLTLMANGTPVSMLALDGTASGIWSGSFEGTFYQYLNGQEVSYSVMESSLGSYWSYTVNEVKNSDYSHYFQVTNRYYVPDDNGGDDDDTPTPVVIPNNPTPLSPTPEITTDIPDGDVPQTEIPDGETPLAAIPAKTGDSLILWVLAAGVSGIGLVWVSLLGKKRRDEDGSQN